MCASPGPKFVPTGQAGSRSVLSPPHAASSRGGAWQPVLSAPAHFACASFAATLTALLRHPEHSGPLILRADTLPPPTPPIPATTELFPGWRPVDVTRRILLPRVPERDAELVQTCVRYRPSAPGEEGDMLVLIPELREGVRPPYYHPDVDRLALMYIAHPAPLPAAEDGGPEELGELRIEVVLPSSSASSNPLDPASRLSRTLLHLLETAHRHSSGHHAGYKKRVRHDVLVPREAYQDLYLLLKRRHKHHVSSWPLGTDPRKHVFEDVAIAAFLMLLWKADYPPLEQARPPPAGDGAAQAEAEEGAWRTWGRPPGGFVDLGCGNGLLVHILLQEGYTGYGVDLSARKTWATYPASTQQQLHTTPITPLSSPPVTPPLPEHAFLIGNHADELTPYVPLLATLCAASAWLVIPCCPYTFTGRFTAPSYRSKLAGSEVERRMDEGGEGAGRVRAYLVWMEDVARRLGWQVGVEALRMPSTRNWGLVGRRAGGAGTLGEAEGEGEEGTAKPQEGAEEPRLQLQEGMSGLTVHDDPPPPPAAATDGRPATPPRPPPPPLITPAEGLLWAREKLEEIRRGGGFKVREGKGHH